jgi:hypothetical protein
MKNLKFSALFLFLITCFLMLEGCQKDEIISSVDDVSITERGSTTAFPMMTFYGLGTANELYTFLSGPPAKELSNVLIKGLREDEYMIAIDMRPATMGLYGVSNMSIIYRIMVSTSFGQTPGSALALPLSVNSFSPAIAGSIVGFDFDPRTDIIRLVTEKGQNLRISPVTGQVMYVDFPINPPLVAINSLAFAPKSTSTSSGALYDIDFLAGRLFKQNPSTGGLTLVGSTGLMIDGEGGFDISRSGIALAVLHAESTNPSGSWGSSAEDLMQPAYRLYSINLRTGQASSMGKIKPMIGIAIQ